LARIKWTPESRAFIVNEAHGLRAVEAGEMLQ